MAELPVKLVCPEGQEGTIVPSAGNDSAAAIATVEDMVDLTANLSTSNGRHTT